MGADAGADSREWMRERILRSGCRSGFLGADFKSCDLSEPIRLGSGCSRERMLSGADALGSGCSQERMLLGADAGADSWERILLQKI